MKRSLDLRTQGDAKDDAGSPAEALELYQKAEVLNPQDPGTQVGIANMASKLGNAELGLNAISNLFRLKPESKTNHAVVALKTKFEGMKAGVTPEPGPDPTTAERNLLPREARPKLDALQLILEDADGAKTARDRLNLIKEFLEKSAALLQSHPEQTNLWVIRAIAALEANQPREAWEAGKKLVAFGLEASDNPKIQRVLAKLERKGWLGASAPTSFGADWENSLGMKFVPVAGTSVMFSIWDTRVQDYQVFADATHRPWQKPGFEQSATHPAVNVSWDDAKAFCLWLTQQERAAGRLSQSQGYRLPMDGEWSVAVGLDHEAGNTPKEKNAKTPDVYPWGIQWPPPLEAGNYAESLHVDSFPNTSPVGSFAANNFGLYDMGGNVWQWCENWYDGEQKYRVLRGASWVNGDSGFLLSSFRNRNAPDNRNGNVGFRCVLAGGASAPR